MIIWKSCRSTSERSDAGSRATGSVRLKIALSVATFAVTACGFAPPPVKITPENLVGRLRAARGGETLKLSPGIYGNVIFPRKAYNSSIKIDASGAVFTGLVLNGVSGVEIRGGSIRGIGGRTYGIGMSKSSNIRVEGMTISGSHRGIVINESSHIGLVGIKLTGLISDGIDIALSRHVLVQGSSCRNFSPTPATYSATGMLVKDGDHADCIQAWSRPTAPPTSDLTIIDNDIEGNMQGIFLGNHVRNNVDDGGFDRVRVQNNRVTVGKPNGIVAGGVRDGFFTGNTVLTTPGAMLPNRPTVRIKAKMLVTGLRNVVCDNVVPDVPKSDPTRRCSAAEKSKSDK